MNIADETVVAIIDSGWDRAIADSRVLSGVGLVNKLNPLTVMRSDDDADENGHGTACGMLVLETAPSARLLPIKVFGTRLETSVEHLCDALQIASEWGARVASMSLSTLQPDAIIPLYRACDLASARGMIVVAAAFGGAPSAGYPAAFANVISVQAAAFDASILVRRDQLIDVIAPGTGPERGLRKNATPSNSYAAARVAGLVARSVARRHLDLDAILDLLDSCSKAEAPTAASGAAAPRCDAT